MPYSVAKAQGGDTPASDAWIERCVTSVMKDGTDKSHAVAICKAAWAKHQAKGRI